MMFGLLLGLPLGWGIHHFGIERYALIYLGIGAVLFLFARRGMKGGALDNFGIVAIGWPVILFVILIGLDEWIKSIAGKLEAAAKKPSEDLVERIADQLRDEATKATRKQRRDVN